MSDETIFFSKMKGRMSSGKPSIQNIPKPLWNGPEQDGVTYSMLSSFLNCRERFRVKVIEGWRPVREFNHRIEYGHMFHACDEAHAGGKLWQHALDDYRDSLGKSYSLAREDVTHWSNVCRVQFAEYLDYWKRSDKSEDLTAVGQERVFDHPYTLPSGRTVRLRGKMDGVYRKGKAWTLRETKTKGDVHVPTLMRQLTFDLQCMLYLTVLCQQEGITGPVRAVYNVVRRPLSGGVGSIRQHKPTKANPRGESKAEFYARLGGVIREQPEEFFSRFAVGVQPTDVAKFRTTCLDPLLEAVCSWYDWVTGKAHILTSLQAGGGMHYRHPYGVRNMLDEGGSTDYDTYLDTGNTVGLERVTKLFEEL